MCDPPAGSTSTSLTCRFMDGPSPATVRSSDDAVRQRQVSRQVGRLERRRAATRPHPRRGTGRGRRTGSGSSSTRRNQGWSPTGTPSPSPRSTRCQTARSRPLLVDRQRAAGSAGAPRVSPAPRPEPRRGRPRLRQPGRGRALHGRAGRAVAIEAGRSGTARRASGTDRRDGGERAVLRRGTAHCLTGPGSGRAERRALSSARYRRRLS
jgi:hypothetical protein